MMVADSQAQGTGARGPEAVGEARGSAARSRSPEGPGDRDHLPRGQEDGRSFGGKCTREFQILGRRKGSTAGLPN